MNEVMVLAEELGVEIWYQDTDSMHMDYNKVDLLGEAFKNKYNRELIGEDLGQFHVDFEMDSAADEIYSNEGYFIAKKTYFDNLESKDEKGYVINHEHTRLKAIPESCIDYTINKENIDVKTLFKKLYNGEEILFDLTEGGEKCTFKYDDDLSVRCYKKEVEKKKKGVIYTESEFSRNIKFDCNIECVEVN